jgi:hypothetical protein
LLVSDFYQYFKITLTMLPTKRQGSTFAPEITSVLQQNRDNGERPFLCYN